MKNYNKPYIEEEKIEIEACLADTSSTSLTGGSVGIDNSDIQKEVTSFWPGL